MIRFGPWSTALAFGALFGFAVAAGLLRMRANAVANRLLAGLLIVIALKLMPYVLGYAGFYDAWPWLSFAPFDLALAIGPLLYLHVVRLTSTALPLGWWRHFIPALVQGSYYAVLFACPLSFKNAWDSDVQVPWVVPFETTAELASIAIYLALAWRRHRAYQAWLADHISNRDDFRLEWLRNFILALSMMLLAWAAVSAASVLWHLNYYERFPFYIGLTVLVFYLGLEGWRHAELSYPLPAPSLSDAAASGPGSVSPPGRSVEGRDWSNQGQVWLENTRAAGWWRDPDLSLDRLARHLGTNTAYLSRALNEGLGLSFSDAIGRLRVDEVQRQFGQGARGDLLTLAYAAGFSSKTSFNRTFKSQTGKTPSQYRESVQGEGAKS